MKNPHLSISVYLLCLLLSIVGCTRIPGEDQLPSPTYAIPTLRPSPTFFPSPTFPPSSTPEEDFSFPTVTILEDHDLSGFSILGFLINNTNNAVTEVEIRATLQFDSDKTPILEEIRLPYRHVLPSESVPFLIHFPTQLSPENILLEVVDFQISGYVDAVLEVEITGRTDTPEGDHILYGWMSNTGSQPTQIHQFHLLISNSYNEPMNLVSSSSHPSSILPHQIVPFLVTFDQAQDPGPYSFRFFLDATVSPKPTEASFSYRQHPEVILDSQGNLLLRGIILNEGKISRWVSAQVVLLYQDQIVSLATLKPPFPIGPGETHGFGLTDFPGWRERLNELDGHLEDLSIKFFYDPLACGEFKGQISHLTVDISGFESTGSTLFIKGSSTNPSSQSLSLPTIQVEIRSTAGFLHTANWILLDEIITKGETLDFIFGIRLPAGIKLSEMEIDIIGIAVLKEAGLPF